MALITMRNVTIAFEGVAAIEHVNLSIERGDYLVIVGENGSGKSTLMRAILGLVRPHSGQVLYGDGLRRSQIGYLPQQTAAQRDFPASVEEVVMSGCINRMGRRLFFAPAQRKLAEEKMRMMDVEKFRRKPYRVLSGGQQQRVLLARALCATDSILLLDEPVTGLESGGDGRAVRRAAAAEPGARRDHRHGFPRSARSHARREQGARDESRRGFLRKRGGISRDERREEGRLMARALEALLGRGTNRRAAIFAALLLTVLAVLLLCNLPAVGALAAEMGAYLQYKFIRRALIVGALVALCAALLGVILVLKRYSMIGDGLSHVGFGALTAAVSLGTVTADALPGFLPQGLRTAIARLCAQISAAPLVSHAGGGSDLRRRFCLRVSQNKPHRRRFGHRHHLHHGAGGGRNHHVHQQRHEHRRVQLHVRKHSRHGALGRDPVGDSLGGGAGSVRGVLSEDLRRDLRRGVRPGDGAERRAVQSAHRRADGRDHRGGHAASWERCSSPA